MSTLNNTRFFNILIFIARITLILLFLVALGCDFEQSASPTKPSTTTSVLEVRESEVNANLMEKSRQLYQWYCTQCHGDNGRGDGVNAPSLVDPPRDHTKADYLETRSDQQLFDAIKLGGLAVGRAPCMPAWGYTFDDVTINSLVKYIREICDCKAL